MENKKERKLRIFCPADGVGFISEEKPDIYCRAGDHFLSSEFPPKKSFWAYCCGCQRYYPFSFQDSNTSADDCKSCSRKILKSYLCGQCNTISFDLSQATSGKKYFINSDSKIVPACPACLTESNNEKFKTHNCKILRTQIFTSRKCCPFCGMEVNSLKKNSITPKKKTSGEIIFGKENRLEQIPDDNDLEATILLKIEDEKSKDPVKEDNHEPIKPKEDSGEDEILEENKTDTISLISNGKSKSFNYVGGFLIFLVLIICGAVYLRFTDKAADSNQTKADTNVSVVSLNSQGMNNVKTNATPRRTPAITSFRANSKIISNTSALVKEPKEDSIIVDNLFYGTAIRVIDRASLDSSWYKVKTEYDTVGWIKSDDISSIDWSILSCKEGGTGYISGGNLRSSPIHSLDEENVNAIWEKGSKVKIISIKKGEASKRAGNPYWYEVKIIEGRCYLDRRNTSSESESCESRVNGYMNSILIDCD